MPKVCALFCLDTKDGMCCARALSQVKVCLKEKRYPLTWIKERSFLSRGLVPEKSSQQPRTRKTREKGQGVLSPSSRLLLVVPLCKMFANPAGFWGELAAHVAKPSRTGQLPKAGRFLLGCCRCFLVPTLIPCSCKK